MAKDESLHAEVRELAADLLGPDGFALVMGFVDTAYFKLRLQRLQAEVGQTCF